MSMRKEHVQALADSIAIDKYGHLFRDLPKSEQDNIFKIAEVLADKEITLLTES
jgi:hypothetical protein